MYVYTWAYEFPHFTIDGQVSEHRSTWDKLSQTQNHGTHTSTNHMNTPWDADVTTRMIVCVV